MGFQFKGFFSNGDESAQAAALARWPFCTAKAITSPFTGFGLRAPYADRGATSDEDYERLMELNYMLEQELVQLSASFPALTFVYIFADCFGGTCIYTGFVAQSGQVRDRVADIDQGPEPLERLLRPLGVELQSGYFAPFTRGYW